jgi:hypothetical protein
LPLHNDLFLAVIFNFCRLFIIASAVNDHEVLRSGIVQVLIEAVSKVVASKT